MAIYSQFPHFRHSLVVVMAAVLGLVATTAAQAQGILVVETEGFRLPRPPIIIWPPIPPHPPVPPPRPVPPPPAISYAVDSLEVNGRISNRVAQVEVSQTFVNTGSRTLEASFVFPLPYDGAIDRMTLLVDGKEIPARLLKADEARRHYEEIVRRNRDPALLEWVGTGMFKTSVFPIPPGQKRTVSLRYTQLCRQSDGMVDFLFPLSTAKYTSKPLDRLSIRLNLREDEPIKNVYSPTQEVEVKRLDENTVTVTYSARDIVPMSDFRLMYDVAPGPVAAKLISYKSLDEKDGFFLLLATPQIAEDHTKPLPKTVIFVLDRSGSMSGKKIEQLREAMRFVINNLREGDLFNIIAYDSDVETFRPELQRYNDKTRQQALAFVEGLVAGGSTNIDAALRTALAQLQDESRPNYVVFMTDGLPTTGVTSEMQIVENARKANTVRARIFCFGVGYDVNSRLLDKLARSSRGYTEYVRPDENLEDRISRFYRRIEAPVLTDVEVEFNFDDSESVAPVYRLSPQPPFDLFAGEQLAMVGRYRRSGAAQLVLRGKMGDQTKTFKFPVEFTARAGDESKAFVEKLWAVRRVGDILDEIDLHGKNQELIDELTQLALKHGILTPYTSFFADENVPLHELTEARRQASIRLDALQATEGIAGFAQRAFKGRIQSATSPEAATRELRSFGGYGAAGAPGQAGLAAAAPAPLRDADREIAQATAGQTVRYVGNRVFYRRQGQWIDSTLTPEQQKSPRRIKQLSDEYFELLRKYGRQIAPYVVFDEPVLLNIEGQAYLIEP
ncbi:Von Willebrand factor type A domain protein [Thermogutta terrifontis]|uniref:von Willebrand factor type A domain protein n=1 Tax=Thermogutta terrifontis TaxID=1331910 RepID=A0A286RD45_9BACT|nr:VIT domain-containing protein [Thermogutta terrifontis]ASV73873.1 Von Willebrand factor type A domain protein [Thermogutta terrifontis]